MLQWLWHHFLPLLFCSTAVVNSIKQHWCCCCLQDSQSLSLSLICSCCEMFQGGSKNGNQCVMFFCFVEPAENDKQAESAVTFYHDKESLTENPWPSSTQLSWKMIHAHQLCCTILLSTKNKSFVPASVGSPPFHSNLLFCDCCVFLWLHSPSRRHPNWHHLFFNLAGQAVVGAIVGKNSASSCVKWECCFVVLQRRMKAFLTQLLHWAETACQAWRFHVCSFLLVKWERHGPTVTQQLCTNQGICSNKMQHSFHCAFFFCCWTMTVVSLLFWTHLQKVPCCVCFCVLITSMRQKASDSAIEQVQEQVLACEIALFFCLSQQCHERLAPSSQKLLVLETTVWTKCQASSRSKWLDSKKDRKHSKQSVSSCRRGRIRPRSSNSQTNKNNDNHHGKNMQKTREQEGQEQIKPHSNNKVVEGDQWTRKRTKTPGARTKNKNSERKHWRRSATNTTAAEANQNKKKEKNNNTSNHQEEQQAVRKERKRLKKTSKQATAATEAGNQN